eukprot:3675688-Lingulodinium_polyedra.AAC.1
MEDRAPSGTFPWHGPCSCLDWPALARAGSRGPAAGADTDSRATGRGGACQDSQDPPLVSARL